MDALPAAIGRYEVKAFIARGGMGTLYLAHDPVLQRQVAIKLLREADNEDLRARFTREVRAAANLRHRNIVTIFDVGDQNGQPFMAMEYIHGQTLASIIGSEPPPSTIRRLQFIEDLCDGLAYAHKRGVVHRDIKPANLMVDPEGTLKILDFGIARAAAESGMTQAGLMIGTLNYMSPEQVAGTALDGRSDQFAVGAVFYELMARRQAFPGAIDGGVLNRILNGEPEPLETLCPHLHPAILRIVHQSLRKNPADRFDDLLQMRAAVAAARRTLEDSVAADAAEAETISTPGIAETPGATPRPLRRGPDREELARRRAHQIEEHVGVARDALAAGRYDEAIVRCEEALLLDPNHTPALEIGDRARIARDETAAREHLDQARTFLRSGELTSASQQVREALDLFPDLPDAIEVGRVIAEARVQRDREQQRQQSFEALLARGAEALDEGDAAAALVLADEALALFPADTDAKQFKELVQQAVVARQRQERDQAARQTAADARRLFADGRHADALAVLEEFWPSHPLVSQLWTELSAEASRLAAEAAAVAEAATAAAAAREAAAVAAKTAAAAAAAQETALAAEAARKAAAAAAAAKLVEAVPPPVEKPAKPAKAAAKRAARVETDAKPRPAPVPEPRGNGDSHSPAGRSPAVRYGAAAAVVLVLAAAGYFATRTPSPDTVAPGETRAVITPATPPSTASLTAPSTAPSATAPATAPAADSAAASSTAPPAASSGGDPSAGDTATAAARQTAIEPLRQSVRRLLRRADYRNALDPAARGLAIDPLDSELLGAVSQIETRARTAATNARGVISSTRLGSPSATRAAALMTDAQRFSGAGRREEAARAYWQAEDLFRTAQAEAASAPASTPTPTPPRPATVAEGEPAAPIVPLPTPAASQPEPAPAPPPVGRGGTPPAPAVRSQADDEAQIRGVLAAYAQGYRSLDVSAILRVYPRAQAQAQALRTAFEEAREYDVQIDVKQIRVTGDRAVVSSTVKQSFRPKAGRAREDNRATEFELQKSGSSWVIVDRR